jgi:K+/H+ antiporter YhaU regulatory subunit KhtT
MESNIREKTGCSVIAVKSAEGLIVGLNPSEPLDSQHDLLLIGTTDAELKFLDIF